MNARSTRLAYARQMLAQVKYALARAHATRYGMNERIGDKIRKISHEGLRGKKVSHAQAVGAAEHMIRSGKYAAQPYDNGNYPGYAYPAYSRYASRGGHAEAIGRRTNAGERASYARYAAQHQPAQYGHQATCGQCSQRWYIAEDSIDLVCPRCGSNATQYTITDQPGIYGPVRAYPVGTHPSRPRYAPPKGGYQGKFHPSATTIPSRPAPPPRTIPQGIGSGRLLGDTGSLHEEETLRGYARYDDRPIHGNPGEHGQHPIQGPSYHPASDRHFDPDHPVRPTHGTPSYFDPNAGPRWDIDKPYSRYHNHGGAAQADPYAAWRERLAQMDESGEVMSNQEVRDLRMRHGLPAHSALPVRPQPRPQPTQNAAPRYGPKNKFGAAELLQPGSRSHAHQQQRNQASGRKKMAAIKAEMQKRGVGHIGNVERGSLPNPHEQPTPRARAGWDTPTEMNSRSRPPARYSRTDYAGRLGRLCEMLAAMRRPTQYDDMDFSEYADNVAGFGQDQGYQHGIADPNARQYPGHYA